MLEVKEDFIVMHQYASEFCVLLVHQLEWIFAQIG